MSNWDELLNSTIKRPKIIFRDRTVLESTEDDRRTIQDEIVEIGDKKYVVLVTETTITERVKLTLVREYDPETSYADAIKEFTDE